MENTETEEKLKKEIRTAEIIARVRENEELKRMRGKYKQLQKANFE